MAGVSFLNFIIYYRSELVTLAIALDFLYKLFLVRRLRFRTFVWRARFFIGLERAAVDARLAAVDARLRLVSLSISF